MAIIKHKKGLLNMNICTFTGYLTDDPIISIVGDVVLAEFVVAVYSYRRTKSTGEKSRSTTYVKCQAWHTGAETIERFAGRGTKITINASARNDHHDQGTIIFRVNEFDLCNTGEE
jgi:single-stranded DNA-binding protein